MGVQKTRVKHEAFGNCVKLTNGIVELLVTIDFGPRVIHFSKVGMENMFFEDLSKSTLGDNFEVFGGETIKLFGGHRIWISPEVLPRCYYPDLKPVECVDIENGMEFIAPVEDKVYVQKSISIVLDENSPFVTLNHSIKNCGLWDIELAPWCITMMAPGAKEVIPMPNRVTGVLANRNISLWDYSDMNDSRVYWGKDFITLQQNPAMTQPFKLGINNEAGWGAVFNKGQLFIKFFEPELDGFYPDNGCSYETYTNDKMLEAETLGQMELLEPGDSVSYSEEWELYSEEAVPSNNEDEIRKVLSKHIKGL